MSAHAPQQPRRQIAPTNRALLIFLVTAIVAGGTWAWVVSLTSPGTRTLVGVVGGVIITLASAAAAIAAHSLATVRAARARVHHIETSTALVERETRWLADDVLPALGHHVHNGASVSSVLAAMTPPSHPATQRLLQTMGQVLERESRARAEAVNTCSAVERELDRLADEQLPLLVKSIRTGEAAAEVALAEVMKPSQPAVQRLWTQVARELAEGNRQGAAAMASCAGAAARIQAQATSLLGWMREREEEYGDRDDVFAHLLEADHRISQMGRLADNIALLSGGRSGRRWTKPIVMESVLRGAIGRIGAYRRVHLHSTSTASIAGYAAEGVMHALAELIDNATKFSPHGTAVHVYVEDEDAGLVVTIEDSGLGMRSRERRMAEDLIGRPLNLTTLSGTRLGLAVVGRLAGKYGLGVSIRPSARGGIGVVVLVPRQLIMYLPAAEPLDPLGQPQAENTRTVPPPAREEAPPSHDGEQAMLPKRPRGQTLMAATPATAARPVRRERDTAAAVDRLTAFRQARGTSSDPSPPPGESR
ncbi:MAG TPA: ATP-binding protein [Nonomuraea sp.]|nr:ATP-binding protein [Nonomuraea sp.]